jgi:hypothetical protein
MAVAPRRVLIKHGISHQITSSIFERTAFLPVHHRYYGDTTSLSDISDLILSRSYHNSYHQPTTAIMEIPLLPIESWGPPPSNSWPPHTVVDPATWEKSLEVEHPGPPVSHSYISSPVTNIIAVKVHRDASTCAVASLPSSSSSKVPDIQVPDIHVVHA